VNPDWLAFAVGLAGAVVMVVTSRWHRDQAVTSGALVVNGRQNRGPAWTATCSADRRERQREHPTSIDLDTP
jgi:hypothetical protein